MNLWTPLLRICLAGAMAAALAACGSLPPAHERAAVNAAAADPSTTLARIAAASTPPGEHSGFRLMPLGVYSLDARVQLAQRAQRSLVVQYYQFENDATGRLLMRALREAAGRGVQVRLLVDDLYTVKSQQPLLALSATPNMEVRLFNPFCCGRNGFLSRFVASPHEIGRLNHRMHNKLFIADGVMAVVGGRNIADEYFVLSEAQNFIDMDALVVGKVLPQLESIFDAYWNSEQVWPIADIVRGEGGRKPTVADFDAWIGMAAPPPKIVLPPSDVLGYGPIAEELDGGRMGLLWGEARAIADPPTKPTTMTEDEAIATSVTMKVWTLLMDAKFEVDLTSPYLVPGERGMAAFEDLARRKVKLTLLTNSLAANDEPLVHTGYARYRERLLRSGADLYELSPQRTTAGERFGMFGKSLGRLHSKTAAIDKTRIFIGSMNLDPRSASQNTEMGVVVDSPQLAREMLRVINISKLQNSYRLRIAKETGTLQWLTTDGEKEVILTSEPESSFFQRLHNLIIAPLVPEMLL
ncbi:putative cardiolipin synthase [Variovorax paradoxus]|uniref:Cardiolipin synthase n=1 Tax=Variovorax paradoxus TaxID=34073 RepID=A0AAE3Y4A7_VARPD|nr:MULTISPECIES: phospholipase D family protein [Variovorax]MBD9665729.1 phospholipase D family protein [Variovorax sp. VRV01]MDP9967754.1 putative cardiolipin synthase [Variovorax paradoxus]MDR6429111.1 putative cardiolipin synthase [Variovorax paradoxus]